MPNRPRPLRVLVADDDPDALALLRSLCRDGSIELIEATDGQSAVELARRSQPDLLLLDMVLGDLSGMEVLEQLKAFPAMETVPVMFVSARRDQATKVAAFDAGADDYVVKPYDLREIIARINALLARRRLFEKLEAVNLELRLANARLEELATTDELTGLANARHFHQRLKEEFLRAERYQTPLSLVVADLDGFKAVNDRHGHAAGDRVLAQLAQRLAALARNTDIVGRFGGDEFGFLLPLTAMDEARGFAERICTRIGAAPARLPGSKIAAVGLTCGVACWPDCAAIHSAPDLFVAADQALYAAKSAGRGCVRSASRAAAGGSTERTEETKWPRSRTSPAGTEAG